MIKIDHGIRGEKYSHVLGEEIDLPVEMPAHPFKYLKPVIADLNDVKDRETAPLLTLWRGKYLDIPGGTEF
ncbi:MAG: hypothetical protein A4E42_00992 [Methanoregulaceae archaeon PtaU1.Bin222]|nr:MAG: hypothetical protein A4E42_00992 [Methanoregulaceae archaeon PtaU1.Bin222]